MAAIQIPQANDSTRPGVLTASASTYTAPEDVLRLYLSSIVGIDKTLVRKRWQSKPGTQPPVGTDWAAVGVDRIETQGFPYQSGTKNPDVITRTSWQRMHCIASFYGPNAAENADAFREGAQLGQNVDTLSAFGLKVQGVDDYIPHVPDFAFAQWVDRYDVFFIVACKVTRTYGVRTLASADDIEITTKKGKS